MLALLVYFLSLEKCLKELYVIPFSTIFKVRLFTSSKSGFLPGDSCIAQLLSIILEIETAFDENPTVDLRGVFLDTSKAFDTVWHDGIKLKAYGVEGELLSLLKNYLENREQRVVLNCQTSEWRKIMSSTRISTGTTLVL